MEMPDIKVRRSNIKGEDGWKTIEAIATGGKQCGQRKWTKQKSDPTIVLSHRRFYLSLFSNRCVLFERPVEMLT